MRLPEVMLRTGPSKATIHRRYRDGTFPTPVRLGSRSIGWWSSEIPEWLATRPRAGARLADGRKENDRRRLTAERLRSSRSGRSAPIAVAARGKKDDSDAIHTKGSNTGRNRS
ncbi:MAG: AlpA family phage regulatory protein [Rhodospirillaceae bacterium]|nr:AlpA family phage regulatory protein [Rhodospirillaceae bacterium]